MLLTFNFKIFGEIFNEMRLGKNKRVANLDHVVAYILNEKLIKHDLNIFSYDDFVNTFEVNEFNSRS